MPLLADSRRGSACSLSAIIDVCPQSGPIGERCVAVWASVVAGAESGHVEKGRIMNEYTAITGNVATEPTVQKTQGGATMTRFRVACPNRQRDAQTGEWVDRESSWFTVFAYGSLAENAMKSLSKGMRVVAAGQLKVRDWAKDERSGTSAEVHADSLGLDLRWGKATFVRTAGGGRKNDDHLHTEEAWMSDPGAGEAAEDGISTVSEETLVPEGDAGDAPDEGVPTPF